MSGSREGENGEEKKYMFFTLPDDGVRCPFGRTNHLQPLRSVNEKTSSLTATPVGFL